MAIRNPTVKPGTPPARRERPLSREERGLYPTDPGVVGLHARQQASGAPEGSAQAAQMMAMAQGRAKPDSRPPVVLVPTPIRAPATGVHDTANPPTGQTL